MFKKCALLILMFFTLPISASGAVLYFEPEEITLGPGDSAEVNLKIDVNSGCINTVEGTIIFPNDYLQVADFITGESVISIWVDKPSRADLNEINLGGELHFSGGIPGGYCGKIPGDPGISNIVGRLIFEMPSFIISDRGLGKAVVSFIDPTRTFLNDGFGTADKLLTKSIVINFVDRPIGSEDWRTRIKEDKIPPEPFIIELHQRDSMFKGQYYVIFNTTDKQTGVDRFEILEIRPGEKIGVTPELSFLDGLLGEKRAAPEWKIADMPYVLDDQNLLSTIKMKAIDKAGNEREVEYVPEASMQIPLEETSNKLLRLVIILAVSIIGLFLIVLAVILLIKKIRYNKHEEEITESAEKSAENAEERE